MTGDPWIGVIGASASHVPFIEACERRALSTAVFDLDPAAPGSGMATEFTAVSTHDSAGILDHLDRASYELTGCFTYSSHPEALRTSARIVAQLGLRGVSSRALDLMGSKPAMLEAFGQVGLATAPWAVVGEASEVLPLLAEHGPMVMKPAVGGIGSAGVSLLHSGDTDVEARFEAASGSSADGSVLLEGHLKGAEFSVDGVVAAGEVHVLAVSRKHTLGAEAGYVMAGFATGESAVPSETQSSLTALAERALAVVGLDHSCFSLDVIVSDAGEFVVDVGPLLDAKIDRLLHHAGIDVYGLVVDIACGAPVDPPSLGGSHALRFLFAEQAGTLAATHSEGEHVVEFEREVGDPVSLPSSISDVVGWLMASDSAESPVWEQLAAIDPAEVFEVTS